MEDRIAFKLRSILEEFGITRESVPWVDQETPEDMVDAMIFLTRCQRHDTTSLRQEIQRLQEVRDRVVATMRQKEGK